MRPDDTIMDTQDHSCEGTPTAVEDRPEDRPEDGETPPPEAEAEFSPMPPLATPAPRAPKAPGCRRPFLETSQHEEEKSKKRRYTHPHKRINA